MGHIIGIDVGGTSIKFALFTKDAKIEKKWVIKTNIADKGINIIPDIIKSIQAEVEHFNNILAIGVGTPGAVDDIQGEVVGAYNLGWDTTQYVAKQINEAFNIPVFVGNDANVAALGEKWEGSAKHSKNTVLITLGTGVGGGVVVNSKLVVGNSFAAGEIGHINIERDANFALPCTCGNVGCLETVASATGIVKLANKMQELHLQTTSLNLQNISSKEIFAAAIIDNDYFANQVIDKFADYLGLACSNIANILNPETIIIGGGVSNSGDFLLEKINHYFVKYSFSAVRTGTRIKLASLGNDAGIYGAAFLALYSHRNLTKNPDNQ